jgi:hypothetical protein
MPRSHKTVTDGEFIEIWKRHGGVVKHIVKTLEIGERSVLSRRSNIEKRHGIILDSSVNSRLSRAALKSWDRAEKIGSRIQHEVKNGFALVYSDAHYWPGDKSFAHMAMIRWIKHYKPMTIIDGGDSFDGARISRHAPSGFMEAPSVEEELGYCQEMKAEVEDAAPNKAKLFWCFGNHDSRFAARLAQLAPDYARIEGMDLPDHFKNWQFAWDVHINKIKFPNGTTGPEVVVKHRYKGGIHATHNNTVNAGCTMVTGHQHQLKVTPFSDYNGRRYGVDSGTLSGFGPRHKKFGYAENNPFNWGSGFITLEWRNGLLLPPDIAETYPNGKVYWRGQEL